MKNNMREKIDFELTKEVIEKIFNQYNGLINICVPAKLEVSPITAENGGKAGDTVYPNIVILYPVNIFEFYNYNTKACIVCIIETIIHELFHIDQLINTTILPTNQNYYNEIESAVDFMVYTFINNNIDMIVSNTNSLFSRRVIDCFDLCQYCNSFSRFNNTPNFSWYNRKNIYDHIIMGVINMVGNDYGSTLIGKLIECFETQSKNVLFEINGDVLPILYNDNFDWYIVDINTYNKFMYDSYFKFRHHTINKNECGFKENDNSITLVINTKQNINTMVSIIK